MRATRAACQASQGTRVGKASPASRAGQAGRAARARGRGKAIEREGRCVITGPRMFHSDPDVQQMKTLGLDDLAVVESLIRLTHTALTSSFRARNCLSWRLGDEHLLEALPGWGQRRRRRFAERRTFGRCPRGGPKDEAIAKRREVRRGRETRSRRPQACVGHAAARLRRASTSRRTAGTPRRPGTHDIAGSSGWDADGSYDDGWR